MTIDGEADPFIGHCAEDVSPSPQTEFVSSVEHPDEPVVAGFPPDEAIKRARPLPPGDRLVIEDVPDDKWAAFQEALAGT